MANGESLPLQELLAIPLADLVEAERAAAQASAVFIREVGFSGTTREWDDFGVLRYITFRYQVDQPQPQQTTREVKVPLLSLLPLPLLQVAKAEFDFAVRVDAVKDLARKDEAHSKPRVRPTEALPHRYDILGRVDAATPQAGVPRIQIKLEVSQSDLPAGIATVLRKLDLGTRESGS